MQLALCPPAGLGPSPFSLHSPLTPGAGACGPHRSATEAVLVPDAKEPGGKAATLPVWEGPSDSPSSPGLPSRGVPGKPVLPTGPRERAPPCPGWSFLPCPGPTGWEQAEEGSGGSEGQTTPAVGRRCEGQGWVPAEAEPASSPLLTREPRTGPANSQEGLAAKTDEELSKLNSKETTTILYKWAKNLNRDFKDL